MSDHEIKKCPHCGVGMEDYKTQTFRIGGLGGEWSFLLGGMADIAEQPVPLHIYICPNCDRIELFAHKQTKNLLLTRRGLKKCAKCEKEIPLASEECQNCGAKQPEWRKPIQSKKDNGSDT